MGNASCDAVYSHPPLRNFVAQERRGFDLIITEAFSTNCALGLVHRFRPAPYIGLSSCAPFSWDLSRVGSPVQYAVMPQTLLWLTDDMTLWERVVNTVYSLAGRGIGALFWDRETQRVVDKHFGPGVPPIEDIAHNMSLLITNTHPALNGPRPFGHAVVEVGGLHIGKQKPLPKDLETFVSGAKDGLIVFSLGSMVRTSSIPKDRAVALLDAFGTLKQRVVWKWEGEAPGPVPSNVLLSKWLPQFDVVCHNNTRLFIGHGGLLSTTEAAYCGVPMLGIAFFGDQHTNMAAIAKVGSGRKLSYSTLKDAGFFIQQVRDLLENHSYRENAKRLSARFHDRPMSAVDTAVFWTEHVIRHGGAPHLLGAARRLYWHQELLLDVLAVVLLATAAVLAVLAVLAVVLRTLVRRVRRLVGSSDRAKSSKKQKRS
ncbi:hypothetical protein ONE63_001661 [Megalurothrips usitatus]|uniref:UDP-glucuronosyltransferase n=1 Tax=Megalurothrips usitatus TaxID=439358 RepID=A0AAV7X912_9NEOP|nr:hypothetical protein ONE63_001661 [Megalurothrips usitatus]